MATEHKPAHIVRVFREAQSRANNVAHDLGDLEWINQTDEQVHARLLEIQQETAVLLRRIGILTEHHALKAADSAPGQPTVREGPAIPLSGTGPGEAD